MASRHVVVDGSNIATEGRSMPSLAQLDQAVREFMGENPDDVVTVVVDASFGHRIDPSEVEMYEEAETAGELVSPPAGAIGRGDAFLLRIADKMDATVLSNDSFQEFHGEHVWLFDRGRLVGGKPVPGVGWIFTPRTPVRGPKSREAVKEAKRTKKGGQEEAPSAIPGLDLAAERARGKGKGKRTVERAIAVATEEAVEPKDAKRRRRRSKGTTPPAEPVNEPLVFITFIAAHPLGTEVEGTVDSFASHGAFVMVEGARCYLPLSAMGAPPPRSAREVFARGDTRRFVVQALDPQRRGIELALPGFVRVAGTPTEETVEAEIEGEVPEPVAVARLARRRRGKADAAAAAAAAGAGALAEPASASATAGAPAPAPGPAPAKRARKAGAASAGTKVAAEPVSGRRAGKAAKLAAAAPLPEPVSAPAKRSRKAGGAPAPAVPPAVAAAAAPVPAPAKRSSKAGTVVEPPIPQAPAPAPAKRSRTAGTTPPTPALQAAPAPAKRSRTAGTTPPTPALHAPPAPAKRSRRTPAAAGAADEPGAVRRGRRAADAPSPAASLPAAAPPTGPPPAPPASAGPPPGPKAAKSVTRKAASKAPPAVPPPSGPPPAQTAAKTVKRKASSEPAPPRSQPEPPVKAAKSGAVTKVSPKSAPKRATSGVAAAAQTPAKRSAKSRSAPVVDADPATAKKAAGPVRTSGRKVGGRKALGPAAG